MLVKNGATKSACVDMFETRPSSTARRTTLKTSVKASLSEHTGSNPVTLDGSVLNARDIVLSTAAIAALAVAQPLMDLSDRYPAFSWPETLLHLTSGYSHLG